MESVISSLSQAAQQLLSHYETVRARSESLCAPLKVEDYVPQPVYFASPPKWHLAHTSWFFEAFVLEKYLPNYACYDSKFSHLFNSYYNNAGDRILRSDRGLITRPSVEQVYAYRKFVDAGIKALIQDHYNKDLDNLLTLGLNHEQQHQELLITDLKHTFHLNPIYPVYQENFSLVDDIQPDADFVRIEEGTHSIGHSGDTFCYDNELGRHQVYLHAFEIARSLVTNKEYANFIESGGYQDFNFWLDDGWAWVNEHAVKKPIYWQREADNWSQYTLGGLVALNPNAPVSHINFYEASAFAEWAGMRLPTEFEWETASSRLNWGTRWEWTNSAYLPYPFFAKDEGAIGEYNGKFMINQMVLRGASNATAPGHSRHTYRNFFYPDARWQVTGLRLARTI